MTKKIKTFDVYIAIPYTKDLNGVDSAGDDLRQQRYHWATQYLAILSAAEMVAFSPITHSHPMRYFDLPTDWAFWGRIDLRIIEGCHEMHVLTAPGWRDSVGVQDEIRHALAKGVIVKYINHLTHVQEALPKYEDE